MKDSKDIFDLFKNNEDKLNQPPSDRAWDRLEARLDNHKQNSPKPQQPKRAPRLIRKWLSMTGVLLVLVLAISGLSNLFQSKSTATAMNQKSAAPQFVLEEIGVYSDQDNNREDMDLYRSQLNRLNTNPILEGDPSKELRIQQSIFINQAEINEKRKNEANLNQKPRQIAAKNTAKKKASKVQDVPSAHAGSSETEIEYITIRGARSNAPASQGDEYIDWDDVTPTEETNTEMSGIAMDEMVTSSISTSSSVDLGMAEAEMQDYAGTTTASSIGPEISELNWLLGQWESPSYNNEITIASATKDSNSKKVVNNPTFEEWTLINDNTISGKGFILDQGKKTALESMEITLIGKELYYILNIGNRAPLRYKLKSYSSHKVVFENKELPFPNQVILQRSANGKSFSTIFKNNTPLQLEEDLRKYFEQRNEISAEQIKRVMERKE